MTCVGSRIGSLDPRCNFSMDGGELSKTDITTIYHWIHGQVTAVNGFGFLKIRSIGKRPDLGNADFITLEGDSPKLWNLYETALRKYEFGGVGIGWPVLSETGRRPAAHHIYFDSRKLKGRAKDYFLITSDGVPPNVTSISQARNQAEFNRALQAVKAEYLATNPTIGDEIRNSDISASDVFKGFESLLWGGAALVGGILLYSVWQSFRPAAQAISTRASRIIEGGKMALPLLEIFSALADHQAAAREAQEAERERAEIQAQIAQVTKDAEETVRKGMDQAQDYARQVVEGRELEAHGREGLVHRDLRKCKERVQSLMREISGLRRSQRAPLRVAPRGLPYSIQVGRNE